MRYLITAFLLFAGCVDAHQEPLAANAPLNTIVGDPEPQPDPIPPEPGGCSHLRIEQVIAAHVSLCWQSQWYIEMWVGYICPPTRDLSEHLDALDCWGIEEVNGFYRWPDIATRDEALAAFKKLQR